MFLTLTLLFAYETLLRQKRIEMGINDENRFEPLLPLFTDADDGQSTARPSAAEKQKSLHPETITRAPSSPLLSFHPLRLDRMDPSHL